MSSRQHDFKKSFQTSIQSLLTALSKEDVYEAFSLCSNAEKEMLYRLLIQVVKALHENLAEEFESQCQESKVYSTFDKIEQLVEEQKLDPLHADEIVAQYLIATTKQQQRNFIFQQRSGSQINFKMITTFNTFTEKDPQSKLNDDRGGTMRTNIGEVKEKLSTAKMNEIQYLKNRLQKVEEQNNTMEGELQLSLENTLNVTEATSAVEKLRHWNAMLPRKL